MRFSNLTHHFLFVCLFCFILAKGHLHYLCLLILFPRNSGATDGISAQCVSCILLLLFVALAFSCLLRHLLILFFASLIQFSWAHFAFMCYQCIFSFWCYIFGCCWNFFLFHMSFLVNSVEFTYLFSFNPVLHIKTLWLWVSCVTSSYLSEDNCDHKMSQYS